MAVTLHQGEYALTVKGVGAPFNAQLGAKTTQQRPTKIRDLQTVIKYNL